MDLSDHIDEIIIMWENVGANTLVTPDVTEGAEQAQDHEMTDASVEFVPETSTSPTIERGATMVRGQQIRTLNKQKIPAKTGKSKNTAWKRRQTSHASNRHAPPFKHVKREPQQKFRGAKNLPCALADTDPVDKRRPLARRSWMRAHNRDYKRDSRLALCPVCYAATTSRGSEAEHYAKLPTQRTPLELDIERLSLVYSQDEAMVDVVPDPAPPEYEFRGKAAPTEQNKESISDSPITVSFTEFLIDALPINDNAQTLSQPSRPLPLESLKSSLLIGGSSGQDILTTLQNCKTCGYCLDAFISLGGVQAYIIADALGNRPSHFFCAIKWLQEAGVSANDWEDLIQVLVAHGLYLYWIPSQHAQGA